MENKITNTNPPSLSHEFSKWVRPFPHATQDAWLEAAREYYLQGEIILAHNALVARFRTDPYEMSRSFSGGSRWSAGYVLDDTYKAPPLEETLTPWLNGMISLIRSEIAGAFPLMQSLAKGMNHHPHGPKCTQHDEFLLSSTRLTDKYLAFFYGRPLGADGECYWITTSVPGDNRTEAETAISQQFEHVMFPVIAYSW